MTADPSTYYGHWLPIDISTHGHEIDFLINLLHVFMAVLFVGWGALLIYMLIRFRERPGHGAKNTDSHFTFSKVLEVGVFVFELFVLFALAIPVTSAVKAPPAEDDPDVEVIRVVAQQFAWNVHYPGQDGIFGATKPSLVDDDNVIGIDREGDKNAVDDVVMIGEMNIPVNKKILVKLSSKDVIHSFWIPVLRVKHDAIPGMTVPLWFEATETGEFEIVCAQLCGNSHYRMRGYVTIQSEDDYEAFLQEEHEYLLEDG